jgi:serine/threonine-protein phosphatase Stp1
MSGERFRSWAATDPGAKRSYNEDGYVDRPETGLWAVADGAGGHASGEVASGALVQALQAIPAGLGAPELLSQVRLSIAATHRALCEEGARRGSGVRVASTIVVLLARDGHFACLWAGDSRAYLLRGGVLSQVTRDHSLVQELVEAGAITAAEAENHPRANVITRAVGADIEGFELDKTTGRLAVGDRLLLCSDGLSKTLSEAEITTLLGSPDGVPPTELLIAAALARQANDNVTAVVVEVMG